MVLSAPEVYYEMCEPVLGALCLLAADEIHQAVEMLFKANEPCLAFVVDELLRPQSRNALVIEQCARLAEQVGLADIARSLLGLHPNAAYLQSLLDIRLGLPVVPWNGANPVVSALLNANFEESVELAVQQLHALFTAPAWTLEEARALLDPLEYAPVPTLGVNRVANVLCCAAYVGLVEALTHGAVDVLMPLQQTLANIREHQKLAFPVDPAEIELQVAIARSTVDPQGSLRVLDGLALHAKQPYSTAARQHHAFLRQRGHEERFRHKKLSVVRMVGDMLPAGAQRRSVLTNVRMRGSVFTLEDGVTVVGLNEAYGWVRFNRYSPLNTGWRLYS